MGKPRGNHRVTVGRTVILSTDFDAEELDARAALIRKAKGANRRDAARALQRLWRVYHCRLPMVESWLGWTPGGRCA